MICLRCGYCCKHYAVVIVDDPSKGLQQDNLICYPGDSQCKHLQGTTPGTYLCTLHDYPWYSNTPCYAFDQVGVDTAECRVGRYMIDKYKKELLT